MRRFFVCLVMGTCAALFCVHQRILLIRLGYQVESTATLRDELLDQNRVLQYNVSALESPRILDERLSRQSVELAPAQSVEVMTPRFRVTDGSAPKYLQTASAKTPWWQQTLRNGTRWLEESRQAIAAPAKD